MLWHCGPRGLGARVGAPAFVTDLRRSDLATSLRGDDSSGRLRHVTATSFPSRSESH